MKKLACLLLALAACEPAPAAPPPAGPAPTAPAPAANPNAAIPLYNPAHAEMQKEAPKEYTVRFTTSRGDFVVRVVRDWAPRGADRFYNLVRNGYYDSTRFFRVVPNFVVQWGIHGDPPVTSTWQTAAIPDDPVKESNKRGTITFATSGANSRTTQVFLNLKDNTELDKMGFSPFGKIIGGQDVVDQLHDGYGEGAPRGQGPDQGLIQRQGNAYLMSQFPKLDFIQKATIAD